MAIDKSLRQHYDVPGTKKIEGQLHRLAYITAKEAKALKKMGGISVVSILRVRAHRTEKYVICTPNHRRRQGCKIWGRCRRCQW